jgi:metal-dependent HD superfamily phosphatase/phosphodiesterase
MEVGCHSAYSSSQEVEAAGSSESSVNFYQSAWHLIPGDENVQSYCHENLKTCVQKEHYSHH